MAEGDITVYNNFKEALMEGSIDLLNDTIKVALLASYTPDIDAHDTWDDVSSTEESGTGYSAGGETLANVTVTQDDTDDEGVFDADDVTWSGLDVGTPSHAIIYKDSGTPSTSPLIAYVELGVASNGQDYTISWGAEGIINLT